MTPFTVLTWVLSGWLAAFTLLIAMQMANGRISLKGLLTMDGERSSPERLQLFMVTLFGIFAFAQTSLSHGEFPQHIPDSLLTLFAGSHIAYLGGKTLGR